MVKLIFDDEDPTLQLADAVLEKREAEKPKRSYLGISGIGDCNRKSYYRFHGIESTPFKAKTLKNFRDGFNTEDLVIADLRTVKGLTVVDREPDSGKQIEVSDFDGHFQGHLDFEVLGIKQAPKTWHVGEVKCSAEKKFNEFKKIKDKFGEKQTLFNWSLTYFVQAQLYMHYRKRKRHWMVVASAGGRDWTSCRTNYDAEQAKYYIDRAKRIIEQPEILPDRISESSDFWLCRFCEFSEVCHDGKRPVRHCRTCIWGEAGENKTWKCRKHETVRSIKEQAEGCEDQLYRPTFVAGTVNDIGDDYISYETLNGHYTDKGASHD